MKLLVRYLFRAVHAIVGPLLLGIHRLTAPAGVQRSPADQQRIDEQTRNLVMYQFLSCPFCIRTRRAIRALSLDIETRDAHGHAPSRQELLQGGGQVRVPCLRITDSRGNVEWMYESADIIRYLQNKYGSL